MIRRFHLFLSIVYRPVTSDAGDTWLQAWRKYHLRPSEAWQIARTLIPMKPRLHPALESPEVRAKRAHLRQENARFTDTLREMPVGAWPKGYGSTPTTLTLAVWRSRRYLVQIVKEMHKDAHRLTVNRTTLNEKGDSWEDGITWDELMEIKRQCGYSAHWAIEIYPPDTQIVNVANMRHLWLTEDPPKSAWLKKSPH